MNVVGVVRRIRDLGRLRGYPLGAFFLVSTAVGVAAVGAPLAQAGEGVGQPPIHGLGSSTGVSATGEPSTTTSSPQVIEITPADPQPTPVPADLPPSVGVDLNPVPLDVLQVELPVRLPTGRRARVQVEIPPVR